MAEHEKVHVICENLCLEEGMTKEQIMIELNGKASKQVVDSLASGSPLVASSVSGMTDTTRVYVNTSNGHWYWYNGSSWQDGGVYQAAEDSDTVTKLQNSFKELQDNFILEKNLVMIETLEHNYVHSSNGIGNPAAHWQAENYITVKVDVENCNYITCNSDIYRNAFFIYVDENDNVTGIVRDHQDNSKPGYVYEVVEGSKYAWISFNTSNEPAGSIYNNYGLVVLNGIINIANPIKGISNYPYGKSMYYADNLKLKKGGTIGNFIKKIYYVEKDGSGDFDKLTDAIIEATKYQNSIVYVGEGTWNIIEEFGSTEMETMNRNKRGLYLKNGVHVICSSRALIIAKYTGTNDTVREWFSAFNAGVGGFILENATIETDNIRYAIHDERDSDPDSYKNHYINCNIKHTNGFYSQCIGGGLGLDGHIIIEGCRFKGRIYESQGTPLVSYHNSADGAYDNTPSKGAKSFIEIKGNYFEDKGRVQLINFGKSDKITVALVHGNSMGMSIDYKNGSLYYHDNISLKDYCNEYRTSN